ncbi:MAG: DNA primase, partial [Anaeroplasmataceae bacterium]|nr:DNA primase [Anaeroplasmataceae bacterium]
MATQEEITKIIESTDMVELVSPYVKLTKQGKNYKGLCPFHNEDTPSFVVSQDKHLAHCFGCGKGGNPIQFLMDIKLISFPEALTELAKKNGIELQEEYQP